MINAAPVAPAPESSVSTPDNLAQALYRAAARATLAPSIHNTQPWRFVVSDGRLELFADRRYAVPVIDPSGRQLAISCGAALFGARVALASAGLDAVTTLLPDPAQPDLLASITVVGEPGPADDSARRLDEAADDRHSNRRRFGPALVPDVVLEAITRAAQVEGAVLAPVRGLDDRVVVAILTQHAATTQSGDPAYRDELRAWISDDLSRRDGVPVASIPDGTRAAHDDVPIRDFDTEGEGELPAETDSRLGQTMLVLSTPGDTPRDWLLAGQALGRVLLELTDVGLKASILSQVTEVPGTRQRLRRELRLSGNVQLLLRAGYAKATPVTPRRPLADVIN